MNYIERFSYESLRNEAHVEYNETLVGVVMQHDPHALNIAPQYQSYKTALDVEVSLLDIIRKSEYTAEINAQDHVRDGIFRGLADAVKSALHHFDADKRHAAEKLQLVFDNYGNIPSRSLDAETAAIDDILRELNDSHSAEVALLNLNEWTVQLHDENQKFKNLMATRYAESAARPTERMKPARGETDRTLRAMLNQIEALALVNGEAAYMPLIKNMNVISERYKRILHHKLEVKSKDIKNKE